MTWVHLLFLLNGLWFTAAFVQFSIAQTNTVKILVPREARDNVLVPTIKASVSFLGGMNLALALFAFYLATGPAAFAGTEQQIVLFSFFCSRQFQPVLVQRTRRAPRRADRASLLAGVLGPDAQDFRDRRGAGGCRCRGGIPFFIHLTPH